jgi:hypothetical protein
MRTITIAAMNLGTPVEITTAASTWGELKNDLANNNIEYNNMKAMIRETETSLEGNNAVLPTGDFVLFLTPDKVKSGKILK